MVPGKLNHSTKSDVALSTALRTGVLNLSVGFKPGNPWMGQERNTENGFQPPKPRSEEPEWTVADKNHDAILLIPDILARLVKLLTFDKAPFSREVREWSPKLLSTLHLI